MTRVTRAAEHLSNEKKMGTHRLWQGYDVIVILKPHYTHGQRDTKLSALEEVKASLVHEFLFSSSKAI